VGVTRSISTELERQLVLNSCAYVADVVPLPLGTAETQLDIVELRLGEPAALVAADGGGS